MASLVLKFSLSSLALLLLISGCAYAQKELVIDSVDIYTNRLTNLVNYAPSLPLLSSYATTSTDIYLRGYGASGIGSLSYRGLAAAQTSLVWNGLQVNSPLLGQADAGQWVIGPYANVSLQSALNTTTSSSQQTAGTLNISNSFLQGPGRGCEVFLNESVGSFGQQSLQLRVAYKSAHRWSIYGAISANYARNNFKLQQFNPDPTLPTRQFHDTIKMFNATSGIEYKHKGVTLNIHGMGVVNRRELPLSLSSYFSKERLDNDLQAISGILGWSLKNYSLTFRFGAVHDNAQYLYPNGLDKSRYGYVSIPVGSNISRSFLDSTIKLCLNTNARTDRPLGLDYKQAQAFHVLTTEISGEIENKNMKIVSTGGLFKANKTILASFAASVNHVSGYYSAGLKTLQRSPTINDLYYPAYGNRELKPEHGLAIEVNTALPASSKTAHKIGFSSDLRLFYYGYASYIQWVPISSIYRPQNLQHIVSRGFNIDIKSKPIPIFKYLLKSNFSTTFTQVGQTTSWVTRPNQFIYSPRMHHIFSISVSNAVGDLYIRVNYTSARYISNDSKETLPYFYLVEAGLKSIITLKKAGAFIFNFAVSNATSTHYQWVNNYATPPATLSASLSYRYSSYH